MKQEYSFTLTVPLQQLGDAEKVLGTMREKYPLARLSRKTDRKDCARFYIRFPFSSARPDLGFKEWFSQYTMDSWDLFGPTYGRWGLY
jgi:hypothetical protein